MDMEPADIEAVQSVVVQLHWDLRLQWQQIKRKKHFYTKETGRALGDPITAVRWGWWGHAVSECVCVCVLWEHKSARTVTTWGLPNH